MIIDAHAHFTGAPPELQAAIVALEQRPAAAPSPASELGPGERDGLRALGYAE